jgi:Zn-dependent protease with chaperone function
MLTASVLLALLAIVLAWPAPIALAAARWPGRAPGVALLLWQAIALAGGLSMIGALLSYGLIPFGDHLAAALLSFGHSLASGALPPGADFFEMFALAGAVLLGLHLLLNLLLTTVRTAKQRRRHLQLVQLLSAPMPERPGMRLIDYAAPVAYCLPGSSRSITVLSAGLLGLLDERQLQAVIAHERAHITQRHHVVLLAFRAWRSSLPWFPIATRALDAVGLLVEMLADDGARHVVPDVVLAQAVELVAAADGAADVPAPASGEVPAADARSVAKRVSRLQADAAPLARAVRVAIGAAAVALVAVPTALLVLPVVL